MFMTKESRYKITSNDYMDLFVTYNDNVDNLKPFEDFSPQILNPTFAVIYLPVSMVTTRLIPEFGYGALPKCYSLMDDLSLEASGITRLRETSALNLRGEGVLIGIIDTGIEYTHPAFLREDGTSRIVSIWDQSIESEDQYPDLIYPAYFGTEYKMEQINEALKSPNPLEIVPSTDENGHGTKLAGIAAGSQIPSADFSGVAPDAELVVVKLKQAKQNLKDFYTIPDNVPCYQENDIVWAVEYMVDASRKSGKPVAICIGLGTSQGAHDDSGNLNQLITIAGDMPGTSITTAAGNEGSARRHFYGKLEPGESMPVELNIDEQTKGFTMELWGIPPMIYTMDILSPNGEYIPAISGTLEESRTIRFVFEQTIININYIMIEPVTGKQIIILNFRNPTQGVWKFDVVGRGDLQGEFHIWLPANEFISRQIYFTDSNSYTTITSPGNNDVSLTVVAYNSNSGTLFADSGKGFSTSNIINPDLAAPGVNIQCPALNHGFTTMSGTSAAAAHTTGITAMILEWGIVDNNYPDLDTVGIKKFLIRGAQRSKQMLYPNRTWGYGSVDVYNTFNIFRTGL